MRPANSARLSAQIDLDRDEALERDRKDLDFVKTLERGLRIFSAFDAEHSQLTNIEIARKTGLSATSSRRFLSTLKALGYLGAHDKRYFVGPKVLEIGFPAIAFASFEQLVRPYLEEIAQKTRWTTAVAVLDSKDAVFIAYADRDCLVHLEAGVGSRFPAYVTSPGRVLLAHLPPPQLEHYLENYSARHLTEYTKTRVGEFREEMHKIRQEGFASVDGEFEVGLMGVAVPLYDAKGMVVAGLNCATVGGSAARAAIPEILQLLQRVANDISAGFACLPALPFFSVRDYT
jgi:IclR family transcriptional regulator, pca regulon regulatory protein